MARSFSLVAAICAVLLLSAAATAGVAVYFGEHQASVSPVLIRGQVMIPLEPLAEFVQAQVSWTNEKEVEISCGKTSIRMFLDKSVAIVNGVESRLNVPPQLVDEQAVFPLSFLANSLSMALRWDAAVSALRLMPMAGYEPRERTPAGQEREQAVRSFKPEGQPFSQSMGAPGGQRNPNLVQISSVEVTAGAGNPVVKVTAEKGLDHSVTILSDPPRLVVDIAKASLGPVSDVDVDGPVLRKVRVRQFQEDTVRMVLDLTAPTGYTVADTEAGMEIKLHHQVSGFELERLAGRATLSILGTGIPEYEVMVLSSPPRLVIDLLDSSLTCAPLSQEVDDPLVKRVRMSQFVPGVTRVVLDLTRPVKYMPLPKVLSGNALSLDLLDAAAPGVAFAAGGDNDPPLPANAGLETVPRMTQGDGKERHIGPLQSTKVVIDPGHGGMQPGAIGPSGAFEKDINLAISLVLEELLLNSGADVLMTRREDAEVTLASRAALANQSQADLFVSVHANAFGERDARGTETLYNPLLPENARLAAAIQRSLVNELGTIDRGTKVRQDLAVLRSVEMPAVLVEVAFIDHPQEERLLKDKSFQRRAAEAIALGIASFIRDGSGNTDDRRDLP